MAVDTRKIKGIRIVSDGTPYGTKIYDAEGIDITAKLQIKRIQWTHEVMHGPTVTFTCQLAELDAVVDESSIDIE